MFYAIRPCTRTRAFSPRQLPTDHDCAVPTRGYQSDQPSHSLLPVTRAAAYSHAPRNPLTRISGSRLLRIYVTLDKVAPYQNGKCRPNFDRDRGNSGELVKIKLSKLQHFKTRVSS
jgi:hypothetical protein